MLFADLIPTYRLFDNIGEPIVVIDREGRIKYKNDFALKLFNKNQIGDIIRLNLDFVQDWEEFYQLVKSDKKKQHSAIVKNELQELVHLRTNIVKIDPANLFLIRLLTVTYDSPQQLLKKNIYNNLLNVFNEYTMPVILSDFDGTVIATNHAFQQFQTIHLKINTFENMNKLFEVFFIPPETLSGYYQSIRMEYVGEIILSTDLNQTLKLATIFNSELNILITTIVQHVVEHEESGSLDAGLKMLGESTAKILHEINNPLATLKGYLELIIQKSEFNQSYLQIIQQEVKRIESLTKDLLFLSNPKINLYEPINIVTLIDEVVKFFESKLKSIHCSVLHYVDIPESATILGNHVRLKQVFINLIKNSIEALETVRYDRKLEIKLTEESNSIIIVVKDNGPGIKKEDSAKVFESFYSTKEKGSGLGLSISKQLIEEHRGTLTLLSTEQQGTSFSIRLPLQRINNQPNFNHTLSADYSNFDNRINISL